MSDDLDTQVRNADPDRWLSSRFIADAERRADVVALYAFDHELARAPKAASNALLGEIRLTWWREVLDEVFDGKHVRHHPTAQALADLIPRRGLEREGLEAMIDARYRELDPAPMSETEAVEWARDTGGRIAGLAAQILNPQSDASLAIAAGAAWALAFRVQAAPDLASPFARLNAAGRKSARLLTAETFPAVAHAVFAADRARGAARSDFARKARITWAVATGRL